MIEYMDIFCLESLFSCLLETFFSKLTRYIRENRLWCSYFFKLLIHAMKNVMNVRRYDCMFSLDGVPLHERLNNT